MTASQTIEDALPEVWERLRTPLRRLLFAYRIPPDDAVTTADGRAIRFHAPPNAPPEVL